MKGEVAGNFVDGGGQEAERDSDLRDAVPVGMPGDCGEGKRKLLGEKLRDDGPLRAECSERADGASELEDEAAFPKRKKASTVAEKCIEPARNNEAERSRKCLLQPCAGNDGCAAVCIGDGAERITKRVEIAHDFGSGGAKLENEASVDNVLACRTPMNEARCVGVVFGDEMRQLFDEGNGEVAGVGDVRCEG